MSPLVTIAIPAYKAIYLRESIASALSQTYSNIEVVVVNDQSPEDIDAVVQSFHDPRLRYYVNEHNLGAKDPSANWNECLRHANGDYFCLLCDDDLYSPTFVEELMQLSERHPDCRVFRSGVRIINAEGVETDRYPSSPEWEPVEDYIWHVYRGLRRQTISEFMLRCDEMEKNGGYVRLPYAWGSDNLSIYHFARQGGIASTAQRLTTYRDSGCNLSSDQKEMDEKLMAFKEYIQQTKDFITTNHFDEKLLPVVEQYYQQAILGHMYEADKKALTHMLTHRKDFGISIKNIMKLFVKKMRFFLFAFLPFLSLIIFSSSTAIAATYTPDNLPIPYLQDKTKYVSNPDGILSQEAVDSINFWLGRMEAEHGVQTVLAVVERIEGGDTYEFCMALGRKYGIGSKKQNSGLIILLSTGDRAYYILTGRGLEGTLPDAICKRIENHQMLPALREGDWDEAMLNTVRAIALYVDGDDSLVGTSDFDDKDDAIALIVFVGCMALGISLVILGIWLEDRKKSYCPSCHQHKMKKISSHTTKNKRLGIRTHHDTYRCTNCNFVKEQHWDEDLHSGTGAAAAGGALGGSIFGSGGSRSFGGGGFFGGGSFGGGGAGGHF